MKKFIILQIENKDQRIYKTGDVARWLPSGDIELSGRIDNQVKINGYRVELGEIQSVVLEYAGINQAVVVAIDNDGGSKSLIAYVIGGHELDPAEVKLFVAQKIPHYMIPSQFVQLPEFPFTPNGKIDVNKLREIEVVQTESVYIPPSEGAETVLAEIWSEVLNIPSDKIGAQANFFDLGGNSLLLIKMVNSVKQEFSTELALVTAFGLPNVRAIAEYIKSSVSEEIEEEEKTGRDRRK